MGDIDLLPIGAPRKRSVTHTHALLALCQPNVGRGWRGPCTSLPMVQGRQAILFCVVQCKPFALPHNHLRREGDPKKIFSKTMPPRYIPQNDQDIAGDPFEPFVLCTSGPPPGPQGMR